MREFQFTEPESLKLEQLARNMAKPLKYIIRIKFLNV